MPVKLPAPIIQFHFETKSSHPRQRRQLQTFLASIFKKEQVSIASLNYIFCSDSYLLNINQQFLKHDDYTDIITFNLGLEKGPVQGEVYISLERVAENARNLQITFHQELHRVIFHGALHLCGYKDKTAADAKLMRKMEDYYLLRYTNWSAKLNS